MTTSIHAESTLTDRYQTTVPETVRRALRLGKRDRIQYTIRGDGEVVLSRASADETADPALLPFLELLARDIAARPDRLQPLNGGLVERIRALVDGVDVDLDAPLAPDNE